MQDKIIAAIAAYLENETEYVKAGANGEWIQFGGVVNRSYFTHAGFCNEVAKEIAAAIAPMVEAGEPDWKDAPEWAEWRTIDGNGDITYWKDKPEPSKRNDYWTLAKGEKYEQIPYIVKNWKESLSQRPK